ncbi:MAG: NAD+ synthase [Gammaproteobacteria bacterium]
MRAPAAAGQPGTMTDVLNIALAQANFCVGDIAANAAHIVELTARARDAHGAQLVVFPELAVTGYPPEDLLFRPGLHRRVERALGEIAASAVGITVMVGYPERDGDTLYNSAAVFRDGNLIAHYRKRLLPNYSVFDEKRYFAPGDGACVVEVMGIRIGLSICEDIWDPRTGSMLRLAGAEMICNLNASPYHLGKPVERIAAVAAAAREAALPVAYANLVGGQDELVFDGASFALDAAGTVVAQAPAFEESLLLLEARREAGHVVLAGPSAPEPALYESVYAGLVLGIRDYVRKNRFNGCVLGLSGGIDSALTLALAVDALGPEAVTAISMPSRFTADMSIDDAREEAALLGCAFHVVPIEDVVRSFGDTLAPVLGEAVSGVTAENLQARSRGVILMAVSNASGNIVLATGNKSEMAVGYATLYGDMAGGFAPLKDIPKTLVYALSRWRNERSLVIPERVITRPPSAELAPGQQDSDSLPPYEVLDPILERYIEQDMTPREIAEQGFDLETVRRVARLVDRNEYKRRQAAPGVRITRRAFGRDRRFPITSRYDEQEPVVG